MDKKENEAFKPFIPADKSLPELTVVSILIGLLLAVVFGAANAYLGLRVGMTVSASIPAAVLSMEIIRVIMRRDSILENNIVQTIGSAGGHRPLSAYPPLRAHLRGRHAAGLV